MDKTAGDQLQSLLDQYNGSSKGFEQGCRLVEYIQKYKQGQHCELIAEFGIHVAQQMPYKLQEMKFVDKVEEFFLACLELKLIDWAQVFLKIICQHFPNDQKSMSLLGMWYEAQGSSLRAQEIYQELLETCPQDSLTVKRLISLFRNNDMQNDAIFVLNKYLETNQNDEEAWLELCDMYLQKQNFAKAQYCMEELVTVNPQNYQHNIKLAEIIYSSAMATPSSQQTQLEICRKYYSHALILIDDNETKGSRVVNNNVVRALWGLIRVCKQIQKLQGPKDKVDHKN